MEKQNSEIEMSLVSQWIGQEIIAKNMIIKQLQEEITKKDSIIKQLETASRVKK